MKSRDRLLLWQIISISLLQQWTNNSPSHLPWQNIDHITISSLFASCYTISSPLSPFGIVNARVMRTFRVRGSEPPRIQTGFRHSVITWRESSRNLAANGLLYNVQDTSKTSIGAFLSCVTRLSRCKNWDVTDRGMCRLSQKCISRWKPYHQVSTFTASSTYHTIGRPPGTSALWST